MYPNLDYNSITLDAIKERLLLEKMKQITEVNSNLSFDFSTGLDFITEVEDVPIGVFGKEEVFEYYSPNMLLEYPIANVLNVTSLGSMYRWSEFYVNAISKLKGIVSSKFYKHNVPNILKKLQDLSTVEPRDIRFNTRVVDTIEAFFELGRNFYTHSPGSIRDSANLRSISCFIGAQTYSLRAPIIIYRGKGYLLAFLDNELFVSTSDKNGKSWENKLTISTIQTLFHTFNFVRLGYIGVDLKSLRECLIHNFKDDSPDIHLDTILTCYEIRELGQNPILGLNNSGYTFRGFIETICQGSPRGRFSNATISIKNRPKSLFKLVLDKDLVEKNKNKLSAFLKTASGEIQDYGRNYCPIDLVYEEKVSNYELYFLENLGIDEQELLMEVKGKSLNHFKEFSKSLIEDSIDGAIVEYNLMNQLDIKLE